MPQVDKTTVEIQRDLDEGLDNQPKETYGWDDFAFPVNGLRVNPTTSKPDYDSTEGEFLFDDSSIEIVVGKQITQHRFKTGTGVEWRPHVHWLQESAGDVKWQLDYKIDPANTAEGSYTSITTTTAEFTYSSGVLHQISVFPVIDMSSYDTTAAVVTIRLSRVGNDVADTYTGDVRFQSFDFHVPIDQRSGSRQEFIK